LMSVTLPNSITKILHHTFDECTSLTSVEIPDSVTEIDQNPFLGCANLKYIQVGSNNGAYCSVEGVLFSKNKKQLIAYPNAKADEYKVPDGVTKIGVAAFSECTGLKSVAIPESVTDICADAFWGCQALLSVTISKNVKEIVSSAFSKCGSLKSIQVDVNNPAYCDIEGVLFSKDKTELITYPNAKATEYKVPDSVTVIEEYAFSCCDVTLVEMGNHVTEIGGCTFSDCLELQTLTITNSMKEIGEWAFWGCDKLKEIICKAETPPSIDWNVFSEKETLYVPKASLEAYREHEEWGKFKEILPIEE